jgi:hypothetical protein
MLQINIFINGIYIIKIMSMIKDYYAYQKTIEEKYGEKKSLDMFWDVINHQIGMRFWRGMHWMPGGKVLWDYIKQYKPTLLTAPSYHNSSIEGKTAWVEDHIPGTPIIFKQAKQKSDSQKKLATHNLLLGANRLPDPAHMCTFTYPRSHHLNLAARSTSATPALCNPSAGVRARARRSQPRQQGRRSRQGQSPPRTCYFRSGWTWTCMACHVVFVSQSVSQSFAC